MDKYNQEKRDVQNRESQRRRPAKEVYDDHFFEEDRFPYEDEGVYYTPGPGPGQSAGGQRGTRGASQKPPPQRNQTSARPPQKRKPAAQRKNPPGSAAALGKGKNQYAMFYIITLVVAVVICLTVFLMVFNSVTKNNSGSNASKGTGTLPQGVDSADSGDQNIPLAANETSVLGMIKEISNNAKTLKIYSIENGTEFGFSIDVNTTLKDKYGENMSFSEFSVGDIVDARYSENSKVLGSLTISSKAWEQKNVTNVKVNTDNKTIVLGNSTYTFNEELKVVNNGGNYDINGIDQAHVISMRGMDNTVWFIEVIKSVGTIEIINGKDIKDGVIEIGTSQSIPVDGGVMGLEDNKIKVLEGTYNVVIRGSNIDTITKEVIVMSDMNAILDLDDAQVVAGVLNVVVNVSDATVTIDGKQIRPNESQVLSYGSHTVRAEKSGYESYETVIEMDEASKELSIALKEVVKLTEVQITTTPSGADIYVDNAYIGVSPITYPIDMDSDVSRRLTVKKSGYIDSTVYMIKGQDKYVIILTQEPTNTNQDPFGSYQNPPVIDDPEGD